MPARLTAKWVFMTIQRKAIALISGGLDSMLAAKLIQEQGIHVEGLNFYTGFCVEGHTHALRNKDKAKPKRNNALWVAEQLNMPLHIIDVIEEYKNVVLNPRFGYGAALNPCLDCKVFMVKKAKEWLKAHHFDFIITGEVVGQRPKSQSKKYLPIVSCHSGADDLLLRPLCAKKLPPSLPEREGWVNREKLLAISGRSRKTQIALANQFQFDDFSQPAGGCCFLTNEAYSNKLIDMWQSRSKKHYELDDIMLLKVGRHLRPQPHFKLIIGREAGENRYLESYKHQYISLKPVSHQGPFTLIDGNPRPQDKAFIAKVVGRFCKCEANQLLTLEWREPDGATTIIESSPFTPDEISKEWYVEQKNIDNFTMELKVIESS